MTVYECTGYTLVRGFKVTHWAPAPANDAERLRLYLQEKHGTDYGANAAELAMVAESAKGLVAGRRISWLVVAADLVADLAHTGRRP